jgi:thiol-disulfide isomerase/thioredoxin
LTLAALVAVAGPGTRTVSAGPDPLAALNIPLLDPPVVAPALVAPMLDGRLLSLDQLRGHVVILNFWATWCIPCREKMPAFQRLHLDYQARGLRVVAVNYRESRGEVEGFARQHGFSFPIVLDEDGAVARRFAVRGLPVTFLLDRNGSILWKAIGAREWGGALARRVFEQVLEGGGL